MNLLKLLPLLLLTTPLAAAEPATAPSTPADPWQKIAPHFTPPTKFANDLGTYRSPLLFDNNTKVEKPEQWPQRRKEILDYWHKTMGDWPPLIEKPKVDILETKKVENYTQTKLRIHHDANDRTTPGYLLVPDGKGPFPAVIVVFYEGESSIGLKQTRTPIDFGRQLTRRGFVTLNVGGPSGPGQPKPGEKVIQPLSYEAFAAANLYNALANMPEVDPKRIGITGFSYGGKWSMFASCLYEKFAAAAWIDGGIVFDESRENVNYWDPWYLGKEAGTPRPRGTPSDANPRTGAYKKFIEDKRDLVELMALMPPRPFLVSGGSEDPPERWKALNHIIAINKLLGHENRVAMTNRPDHYPTPEASEAVYNFFEHFLKPKPEAK
jgi:dienelactone hydrolase